MRAKAEQRRHITKRCGRRLEAEHEAHAQAQELAKLARESAKAAARLATALEAAQVAQGKRAAKAVRNFRRSDRRWRAAWYELARATGATRAHPSTEPFTVRVGGELFVFAPLPPNTRRARPGARHGR